MGAAATADEDDCYNKVKGERKKKENNGKRTDSGRTTAGSGPEQCHIRPGSAPESTAKALPP